MAEKKYFLIDFDGVIKIGDNPAEGIFEFFNLISDKNFYPCILSNSTLRRGEDIRRLLASWGISVSFPVITTIDFALNFTVKNYHSVRVILNEQMKQYFPAVSATDDCEAILIGDIGETWDYQLMNDIFLKVRKGAKLIALHKNKFWFPDGVNCKMDIGGFIEAIEYASGTKSIILGKPSPLYFKNALDTIGYDNSSHLYSIGDDPYGDLLPVKEFGGTGLMVCTGKYPYPPSYKLQQMCDHSFRNLYDLTAFLKTI